ncbi:hypothetical protein L6164_012113 [Bauhinia variegata]|uniref:Uncharacterized protein n=1 Tax=Bauhinia variegata TaxID=167791 RepID=A0ACB9P9C5_BAUVA|nr:hypothetical protein L6164_012113 [Bauhinia variegata]
MYNVLSNVIVNRLKPLIPNLISPNQGAFIKGRKSSNDVMVAQQVIHCMNRKNLKRKWMVIKLDLEKA